MNACALGIDVGTSGVRAAVLKASGEVTGFAATKFAALEGDPSAPATWRRALKATLARLGGECDLGQVDALAVDGTSGTMVAVNEEGEPVGPARMYDEPCEDVAVLDRIAAAAPAGSPALGRTSGLARVLMMQDRPGVARVIHQADWIAGMFSGRFDVSDENNALKTGYDPLTRQWPDWIARTGASLAKLPDVRPPGARIAGAGALAQRLGLRASASICAGTTDGCASFLATGARAIGEAVTALGSTMVVKLLSDTPINAAEYGVYSHRLGNLWLAGGASNTGGKVIEALFPDADLVALTASLQPEAPTGLHFYPLIRPGERFPINDPDLPPKLTPRPAETERFFQAVLEGIAEVEALGYRRLRELGAPKLESVRVPFRPAQSQEACVGAARLASGEWAVA
jgi:sugar (pentulose or hexulose) kinase